MVSVCMAAYNGELYIREQVESILAQLTMEDEIVISDDGSSDNTIEILHGINDSRIKIHMNKECHGFTPNFENALKYAKGDYIFLADQDDIWLPDKVTRTKELLQQYDLVISDCKTVDEKLNVLGESRFDEFKIKGGRFEHFIKSRYIGCCMAFNKNILNAILPFPTNYFLLEHDVWIAAVGLCFYNTKLLKEPMILYRRHGSNTSSGGFEKGYSLIIKIKKRCYRLIMLGELKKKLQKRGIIGGKK